MSVDDKDNALDRNKAERDSTERKVNGTRSNRTDRIDRIDALVGNLNHQFSVSFSPGKRNETKRVPGKRASLWVGVHPNDDRRRRVVIRQIVTRTNERTRTRLGSTKEAEAGGQRRRLAVHGTSRNGGTERTNRSEEYAWRSTARRVPPRAFRAFRNESGSI